MKQRLLDALAHSTEYRKPPFWETMRGQLFIYGTGTFARNIMDVFRQKGIRVTAFMDHCGKDSAINGIPVFVPEAHSISPGERANSVVVLGIHNREAKVIQIISSLKELGFGTIVSPLDLYDHLANELGGRYWLTSRTFYSEYIAPIQAAYDLFADETSRATFASLLLFRVTGDFSLLPAPDLEHQYFPLDLPHWTQPLRFVDCGAYDGDTLDSFLRAAFEFQAVAAYEPDQDNFRKLAAFVSRNRERLPNASLFPCGVSSSTAQAAFETGRGEASAASHTGTAVIQCVTLDESIPTFAPNLIKMDIEGLEPEALRGARGLIGRYRPGLAISVYHAPSHLWEIPLLIEQIARENNLRYTYHLRAHAENGFDTILYAIPKG